MFAVPLAEDSHSYRPLLLTEVLKAHSPKTSLKSQQMKTNRYTPVQGKIIPPILLQ